MADPEILQIIDAAYDVDAPDEEWLTRLVGAVRPHLDGGFGVAGFLYDMLQDGLPRIVRRCHLGIPLGLKMIYPQVFDSMDPSIRRLPFRLGPCVAGSQMLGMREEFREQPHMKRHVHQFGMYDSLWITAVEPSGRGCGFHAGRPEIAWASDELVSRWERIAAHIANAVRLRRRLRASNGALASRTEAVIDPNGKVHDASGPASTESARAALSRAALMFEKARGALRTRNSDAALAGWRGLVAARWSLVSVVESDGRRYILARENGPRVSGRASLTRRERQVVGYLRLGHSIKAIAYALGIQEVTVRVFVARACAKFGVQTRAELVRMALADENGDSIDDESAIEDDEDPILDAEENDEDPE